MKTATQKLKARQRKANKDQPVVAKSRTNPNYYSDLLIVARKQPSKKMVIANSTLLDISIIAGSAKVAVLSEIPVSIDNTAEVTDYIFYNDSVEITLPIVSDPNVTCQCDDPNCNHLATGITVTVTIEEFNSTVDIINETPEVKICKDCGKVHGH